MIKTSYRMKKNNVPVLSKKELNKMGEDLVEDFYGHPINEPMEIDIDRFAEQYLGLEQDYQYLSHCCCYLGIMIFIDTKKVPVYNDKLKCAEYISANAGTMIIDKNLLADNQEHRYRFTVGHEASHSILHKMYYINNDCMMQGCTDVRQCTRKPVSFWSDTDTMEWQVNYLSAAILMPESSVRRLVDGIETKNYAEIINQTSRIFNVSSEAAQNRLKNLNIIPNEVFKLPYGGYLDLSQFRTGTLVMN